MVIPPARTGTANKRRKEVMSIPQTNKGILWNPIPGVRIFKMVVIKLIAPKMEEAPAK